MVITLAKYANLKSALLWIKRLSASHPNPPRYLQESGNLQKTKRGTEVPRRCLFIHYVVLLLSNFDSTFDGGEILFQEVWILFFEKRVQLFLDGLILDQASFADNNAYGKHVEHHL